MDETIKQAVNFCAISHLLNQKRYSIKRSKIPDKYKEDIQELYELIEDWVYRTNDKHKKYKKT
jgi:hypothetical protein